MGDVNVWSRDNQLTVGVPRSVTSSGAWSVFDSSAGWGPEYRSVVLDVSMEELEEWSSLFPIIEASYDGYELFTPLSFSNAKKRVEPFNPITDDWMRVCYGETTDEYIGIGRAVRRRLYKRVETIDRETYIPPPPYYSADLLTEGEGTLLHYNFFVHYDPLLRQSRDSTPIDPTIAVVALEADWINLIVGMLHSIYLKMLNRSSAYDPVREIDWNLILWDELVREGVLSSVWALRDLHNVPHNQRLERVADLKRAAVEHRPIAVLEAIAGSHTYAPPSLFSGSTVGIGRIVYNYDTIRGTIDTRDMGDLYSRLLSYIANVVTTSQLASNSVAALVGLQPLISSPLPPFKYMNPASGRMDPFSWTHYVTEQLLTGSATAQQQVRASTMKALLPRILAKIGTDNLLYLTDILITYMSDYGNGEVDSLFADTSVVLLESSPRREVNL